MTAPRDLLVSYAEPMSDADRPLFCHGGALETPPRGPLARESFMALAARVGIGLLPFVSLACHVEAPANKGPTPAFVRCDSREGGFHGPSELKTAAERDAWVAQHGPAIRESLQGDCAEKFVAFVESTDLSTHTLRFDSGYSAGLPFPASDDGHTVLLAAGRVCGGAYPSSSTQVVRIPTGRSLRVVTRGGDCPRNVP